MLDSEHECDIQVIKCIVVYGSQRNEAYEWVPENKNGAMELYCIIIIWMHQKEREKYWYGSNESYVAYH